MMLAPQVETAFQAGESLLALCEVGQQEKEKFHDDLDDFQAGWGVLQLRAGLRIEKLRSAISQIETFVYTHLNPMLEWIGGAEDVIAPTFLAANDIAALEMYCDSLEVCWQQLGLLTRLIAYVLCPFWSLGNLRS